MIDLLLLIFFYHLPLSNYKSHLTPKDTESNWIKKVVKMKNTRLKQNPSEENILVAEFALYNWSFSMMIALKCLSAHRALPLGTGWLGAGLWSCHSEDGITFSWVLTSGFLDFHMTLPSSARDGLCFLQQQGPWFPHLEAVIITFIRISLEFSTFPGN